MLRVALEVQMCAQGARASVGLLERLQAGVVVFNSPSISVQQFGILEQECKHKAICKSHCITCLVPDGADDGIIVGAIYRLPIPIFNKWLTEGDDVRSAPDAFKDALSVVKYSNRADAWLPCLDCI